MLVCEVAYSRFRSFYQVPLPADSVEKLCVAAPSNVLAEPLKCLSCQAFRVCCGARKVLASLRRFWPVAARRKSSFAPHGPRNRRRSRPRMRLRWAKRISTFFRSLIEIAYWRVLAMSRATCRASSCSSWVILRVSAFGQHLSFEGQDWQVNLRARCFAGPLPVEPRFGSE